MSETLVVILIQASFYALLGIGYVLIYRATRMLNLAHGEKGRISPATCRAFVTSFGFVVIPSC